MNNNAGFDSKVMYIMYKDVRINQTYGGFPPGSTFASLRINTATQEAFLCTRPNQRPITNHDPTRNFDYNEKCYIYTGVSVKRFFAGLKPGDKIAGICFMPNDKAFWWDEGTWWNDGGDVHMFSTSTLRKAMRAPLDNEIPELPMAAL